MSGPDLASHPAQRLGTVLRGKYRLDAILGIGGMAIVYAATHRNQKRFAVKLLQPDFSSDPELRARFLREGYVANTVDHPGAVAVLDDDTAEDGSAFLVMELLHGVVVEQLRRQQGRLPVRAVVGMTDQLLTVLAAAHAKSIVHRDVKPENLFLTREGVLKVLDFGIARVRDLANGDKFSTIAGALLGTPAFMAPEQAGGRTSLIDARTDLWAVGASMFMLLSGETVHDGQNVQELVVRAATRPARSLAEPMPWMDAGLVAVVDRALAFENDARWPTAEAMRDALREASGAWLAEGAARGELVELATRKPRAAPSTGQWGALPPPEEEPILEADSEPAPSPVVARTAAPVARSVPAPADDLVVVEPLPSDPPPALPRSGPPRKVVAALGALAVVVLAGWIGARRLGPQPGPPATALSIHVVPVASVVVLPTATLGTLEEPRLPPPPSPPIEPIGTIPVASLPTAAALPAPAPPPPRAPTPPATPSPAIAAAPVAVPVANRPAVQPKPGADAGARSRHEGKDTSTDWDRP